MAATKGERTRDRIVATAAPLFNQRGYTGASMSDLMAATGLEKGGIYRHFQSKDELALAAFDHALGLHAGRIRSYVSVASGAGARLSAICAALTSIVDDPVVAGGCPLLNTAVETDDGSGALYVELRKRARAGMRRLIGYTRTIVEAGMESGELAPDLDPQAEAEMLIATMEGALMLSKLYDDARFIRQAADRMAAHAQELQRRPRRRSR